MFNRVHMVSMLLLLSITIALVPIHTIYSENEKPVIVCTTSVLASIVRDLVGDRAIVEVIASPSICPAHYDVKPSDIDKVRRASLILSHGIEPWIEDIVKASGSSAPIVVVKGPWNTPRFLKDKYVAIAEALEKYLGIDVGDRLDKCLKAIDEVSEWLKNFAKENGFEDTPVVVMQWQKGYVSFLGFKIVAVYGPPEKVTPSLYQKVVENATKNGALLVIDNLQSGTELGKKIAKEIGGIEVALTNFPETAPGLNNMTEVMKYNAKLLAQALYFANLKNSSIKIGQLYEEIVSAEQEARLWKYAFIFSAIINIVLIISIAVLVVKLRKR